MPRSRWLPRPGCTLATAAGLKEVYRADGSESVYSPERILALGLPQLEFAKQWPAALRGNFARLSFVDYERWLARYDLVLHHGGTGILYYCIAHARPAIAYPVDYDQFDYAARLVHAGLALRLNVLGELETVLHRALNDVQLALRCERFRQSSNLSRAGSSFVELVRQHFAAAQTGS